MKPIDYIINIKFQLRSYLLYFSGLAESPKKKTRLSVLELAFNFVSLSDAVALTYATREDLHISPGPTALTA